MTRRSEGLLDSPGTASSVRNVQSLALQAFHRWSVPFEETRMITTRVVMTQVISMTVYRPPAADP